MLIYFVDIESVRNIIDVYNKFIIASLHLLDIPRELESKPILDGKRILSLLNIKPGPHIQAINDSVIRWQLANPNLSPEDCEKYLLSEQTNGRIPSSK